MSYNLIGDVNWTEFEKSINILMKKARKENCSVTVTLGTDRETEIKVEPFEPFRYSCPYSNMCKQE